MESWVCESVVFYNFVSLYYNFTGNQQSIRRAGSASRLGQALVKRVIAINAINTAQAVDNRAEKPCIISFCFFYAKHNVGCLPATL